MKKPSKLESQLLDITAELPDLIGKLQPQAVDLEKVILGAIMMDNTSLAAIKTVFQKSEVFYLQEHQMIFKAAMRLDKKNTPVDMLLLHEQLKRDGNIEKIGGVQYLIELTNMVSSGANVIYHSRIVYQMHMRRAALKTAKQLIAMAHDDKRDIFGAYNYAYRTLRQVDPSGILQISKVNQSIIKGSKQDQQKRMVGTLLREGDLAIFFGDEGTGKSVFSYQIGDAISKGKDLIDIDGLRNQSEAKDTIMFDFEMVERQLFDRYSAEGNPYSFSDKFYRVSMDSSWTDMDNMANKIIDHIEAIIKTKEPGLAIIDNLTWICDETTDNTIATKVMKKLLALIKQIKGLTILVVAHTPKRDRSQPLESRHLAGAKSLSNYASALFGISKSMKDSNVRYIKQLKCRGDEEIFTEENVLEFTIIKERSQLVMDYVGTAFEKEHLQYEDMEDKDQQINDLILELGDKNYSTRKISEEIKYQFGHKMVHTTVGRKYKKLKSREI